MERSKLAIVGMGFISAAGNTLDGLQKAYVAQAAPFSFDDNGVRFSIPKQLEETVENSVLTIHGGQRLDRAVKLAAAASLSCIQSTKIKLSEKLLVNIGSSRGATGTWETEFSQFLAHAKTSPKASPYSTPGNISSNIATLLSQNTLAIDHSVTCGSGLQAIANAAAWIRAGMADMAFAGGTEAPLTPFTQTQMKALKIAGTNNSDFPAKPLSAGVKTGMVLGEGAAVFILGKAEEHPSDILITGIGLANERINTPSGISDEGKALYESMHAALTDAKLERPDVIITHAPGTEKGDNAEIKAIEHLFGTDMPRLFSNKHIMGHTLGASGTLSMISACHILLNNKVPSLPYEAIGQNNTPTQIRSVLVNATGFGGNAISLVISKI